MKQGGCLVAKLLISELRINIYINNSNYKQNPIPDECMNDSGI